VDADMSKIDSKFLSNVPQNSLI